MTNELTENILEYIDKNGSANTLDLAVILKQDHQKVVGAVKSLQSVPDLINVEQVTDKKWELLPEGQHVATYGSHEAVIYNAVPDDGIPLDEIKSSIKYANIGISKALAAGWIVIHVVEDKSIVRKKVSSISDTVQNHLKDVSNIPDTVKADYKKRKLLHQITIKSLNLSKGENFAIKLEKQEADLTTDLLVNNAWREKKFKPYNFNALGAMLDIGHLHPLLKVRAEFRKIFFEMGFLEMPTNNFVESSFWNFDALFQPQQHPARDAHDTFFVSEPRISTKFPEEYLKRVKKVHSKGGYGSQGYQYDWKIEEAQKNLLRTHTTAVSARMLYKLIQEGEFKPVRYFSIDRVFRNETLDATHLAEFHQVEGVVADYNLTLGDLIGTLYEFFKKLGITQLDFKPAYNPYTEPSMEIFCYHNGLNKWIEIGNSGMFRPEMLLPMGIPENVRVIAWGLSLERPTMIKYGINNIRDLVGPKVDLQMVHDNPICRLEKTGPRTAPLKKKTEVLDRHMNVTSSNLVNAGNDLDDNTKERCTKLSYVQIDQLIIFCNPKRPLYSLETLLQLAKKEFTVSVSIHVHSSVEEYPLQLSEFCSNFQTSQVNVEIPIVLIWRADIIDPVMQCSDLQIFGEVNIARYLNRIIELKNHNLLRYESCGPIYAAQIDSTLEKIHKILHGVTKDTLRCISSKSKSKYVLRDNISVVDIVLNSVQKYIDKL
ncbi:phenylalanine--tRNA ligase alpha subunit isoform X1 [Orussus abietinus]|uniref:phenylalanine--tRNA ligase alpha subunit isoform X1 n=1 Tax=Orussus abietinus TaxID=222816 RepID=UPI000625D782|nr:phenylalanine--tRNA ligase alpha subunit isoform X1 [Orussus abietinus]